MTKKLNEWGFEEDDSEEPAKPVEPANPKVVAVEEDNLDGWDFDAPAPSKPAEKAPVVPKKVAPAPAPAEPKEPTLDGWDVDQVADAPVDQVAISSTPVASKPIAKKEEPKPVTESVKHSVKKTPDVVESGTSSTISKPKTPLSNNVKYGVMGGVVVLALAVGTAMFYRSGEPVKETAQALTTQEVAPAKVDAPVLLEQPPTPPLVADAPAQVQPAPQVQTIEPAPQAQPVEAVQTLRVYPLPPEVKPQIASAARDFFPAPKVEEQTVLLPPPPPIVVQESMPAPPPTKAAPKEQVSTSNNLPKKAPPKTKEEKDPFYVPGNVYETPKPYIVDKPSDWDEAERKMQEFMKQQQQRNRQ